MFVHINKWFEQNLHIWKRKSADLGIKSTVNGVQMWKWILSKIYVNAIASFYKFFWVDSFTLRSIPGPTAEQRLFTQYALKFHLLHIMIFIDGLFDCWKRLPFLIFIVHDEDIFLIICIRFMAYHSIVPFVYCFSRLYYPFSIHYMVLGRSECGLLI